MMVASPTKRTHIGRPVGRIPARWGAGDPPCRSTSCSPVVAGATCARRPTWRGRRSAAGAATPRCRSRGRRPGGSAGRLVARRGPGPLLGPRSSCSILLGALVVACALAIPVVGGVVGFALLAAAAAVYREIIRISGLQGAPVPREPAWRTWPVRYAWGLVIALGLAAPALLRHMIMDSIRMAGPLAGRGGRRGGRPGLVRRPPGRADRVGLRPLGPPDGPAGPGRGRAPSLCHVRGPADRPARPGGHRGRRDGDHRPAGLVRVHRARPLPRQEIRPAPPRGPPPYDIVFPEHASFPRFPRPLLPRLAAGLHPDRRPPLLAAALPGEADLDVVPAHICMDVHGREGPLLDPDPGRLRVPAGDPGPLAGAHPDARRQARRRPRAAESGGRTLGGASARRCAATRRVEAQTSSPTARISASALLWRTTPGRIR